MSPSDILKKPYARILIPEDDGGYSAELLEFPGCFACGKTAGEAIENLEKASISWIEVAKHHNQDIPEPLANYGYSGKLNLRLPRSVHKQAARFAQKDAVSLNQFFMSAIASRVGAEDLYDRLVEKIENRITQLAFSATAKNVFVGCHQPLANIVNYSPFPGETSSSFMPQEPQKVISDARNK
jgi:predicted RNase H-like HicB family nuclease